MRDESKRARACARISDDIAEAERQLRAGDDDPAYLEHRIGALTEALSIIEADATG